MESLLTQLAGLSLPVVCLGCLVENLLVFAGALVAGELITRAFAAHRIAAPPPPLERQELVLAATAVVGNSLVTVVGWELWRRGIIHFRWDWGWRVPVDALVLLVVMDTAMYVLHRIVHHPILFRLVHHSHHRYRDPRPLTLFVLSPLEVAGFGGLWLVVIILVPVSWGGMALYLTLNVVFGTLGHVGVEPFPDAWIAHPAFRWMAGSAFHANHHQDETHNFGFYTQIWDRLFGTLRPTPR